MGALVKNNKSPIQPRATPPHASGHKLFIGDNEEMRLKRYLGSIARSGNANMKNGKPQQKKAIVPIEREFFLREMKEEMIETMKPLLLQCLREANKKYDPFKVDLFLQNLANAIYDRDEEFTVSMDNMRALIDTDYFSPEGIDEIKKISSLKRNIQSIVRVLNHSHNDGAGNAFRAESHTSTSQLQSPSGAYNAQLQNVYPKRNLQSLMKNKLIKRYLGAIVKNNVPKSSSGKRTISAGDSYEYFNDNLLTPHWYNDQEEYSKNIGKRHTMYDINEPDTSMTLEMPSQAGEQTDYSDYVEQMGQDAAIPIGKRFFW